MIVTPTRQKRSLKFSFNFLPFFLFLSTSFCPLFFTFSFFFLCPSSHFLIASFFHMILISFSPLSISFISHFLSLTLCLFLAFSLYLSSFLHLFSSSSLHTDYVCISRTYFIVVLVPACTAFLFLSTLSSCLFLFLVKCPDFKCFLLHSPLTP